MSAWSERWPSSSSQTPVAKIIAVLATRIGASTRSSQQRRALRAVDRRAGVVAREPVAGAGELEQDGRDQGEPDEHVRGEQAAHVDDRGALGEQEDRQQRRHRAREQLVDLDSADADGAAPGFGDRRVSEPAHVGPPGAVRGSGRRPRRAGRARRARARPAHRRRSGSPSRRGGCARAAARRTGRGRRTRSGRRGWSAACVTRPPGARRGSGIEGACTAVHRPAPVAVDLAREGLQRAAEEARGAVGVAAGSAVGDVGAPAQQPRQLLRARGAARHAGGSCRRWRAGRTGTVRTGRRSRRRGSPGRERTPARRTGPAPRTQSTPAPIEPALSSGSPSLEREVAHVLRVEPGPAVAADEQRLRTLGDAAGAAQDVGQRAAERDLVDAGVARRRRRGSRAPSPAATPSPARGTSPAPWRAISAMCASVSTLQTSVGRPRTPRSNGRGGTVVGSARLPLRCAITAVSWPLDVASAAPRRAAGRAVAGRAVALGDGAASEAHARSSERLT